MEWTRVLAAGGRYRLQHFIAGGVRSDCEMLFFKITEVPSNTKMVSLSSEGLGQRGSRAPRARCGGKERSDGGRSSFATSITACASGSVRTARL